MHTFQPCVEIKQRSPSKNKMILLCDGPNAPISLSQIAGDDEIIQGMRYPSFLTTACLLVSFPKLAAC